MPPPALLAEVTRGDVVESLHFGTVLVTGPDGERLLALGDVDGPLLPRSSVKPLQAAAMIDAGLVLADAPSLALAASSHSGGSEHLTVVASILAGAGLSASALANTPDLPLGDPEREAYLRAGGVADALHQNCSGKHAAMVACCVANGWPVTGYLAADHPLQQAIASGLSATAGPISGVEIDGCGAPLFQLTAAGLARGFAALGRRATASLAAVYDAMTAHPELVGGQRRDVTSLMQAVPGLVAKDGADGVYAAATPTGGAAVVKISDGGARARLPVLARALQALGVAVPGEVSSVEVFGGGHPVGVVRPAF